MLIGETHSRANLRHLIPPWPPEPTSPSCTTPTNPTTNYAAILSSLRQNLFPSDANSGEIDCFPGQDDDDFFMYEFKVRMCTRARPHDWTECPFAHPGEKARRRDPRKFNYSGISCPEFRKSSCKKGDSCELAHGVFEIWLHPSKYRTKACKDRAGCTRRVCFFAHSPQQLRVGSGSEFFMFDDEQVEVEVSELVEALRRSLRLNKVKSLPKSWGTPVGGSTGFGSPPPVGTGFFSVPATPTRPGGGCLGFWGDRYKKKCGDRNEGEEEVVLERVESGREVRVRMLERLSKENSFSGSGSGSNPMEGSESGPDFGWVSDLVT